MAKKILVIDDEPDYVSTLKECLEGYGYEVATALNGKEGLERLKEKVPDLIVLDLIMPVMNGFEFYKRIKTDHKLHNIPVLIVTGRSDLESSMEPVDSDEFLSKPLILEDFLARIKPLINENM